MKIVYYSEGDNKPFDTEEECREHEKALKKERTLAVQKCMAELDLVIWKKYYPNDKNISMPELYVNYTWLRTDIVHILSDVNIDTLKAKEDILDMIKATDYSEEIFKDYIHMDSIMSEVAIRSDFQEAFSRVKSVSDLASEIGYMLSKSDLQQLAKLHKGNKCLKKIEDLLTACNFHYECGQFSKKMYQEFLA